MEYFKAYFTQYTLQVIGVLAIAYFIHCALALLTLRRKQTVNSKLFGFNRTFFLAFLLQISLQLNLVKQVLPNSDQPDVVMFKLMYTSLIYMLLLPFVAKKSKKNIK